MSDEPEDDDIGELEVETESVTDWFEVENGYIIAPRGFQDVQDHFGCPLVRISMKPANVEVLVSDDEGQTWKWRAVDKLKIPATVTALRGGKQS